jgi:HEAT repeat protein
VDKTNELGQWNATASDTNADQEARRRAVEAIGADEGEEAWAALQPFLHDADAFVRSEAVAALGHHDRWDEKLPLLIAAMSDPDPQVRDRACDALGSHVQFDIDTAGREAVIGPLLTALADADVGVRQSAAYALAFLLDERAREPLAAALASEDEYLRARAGHALALLGDGRALGVLQEVVKSSKDVWNCLVATEALGLLGDRRATPTLLAALDRTLREDRNEDLPGEYLAALGMIGDRRATVPLCRLLRDTESPLRPMIAHALGDIGGRRAARALKRALRKGDDDLRVAAATALGEAGRGRRALRAALADPCADVRSAATKALGRVGDHASTEAIVPLLSDPEADVRREALDALSLLWTSQQDHRRRADKAFHEPLQMALGDPDEGVCLAAIDAVVSLARSCPTAPLTALLRSPSLTVACAAAAALSRLGQSPTRVQLAATLGRAED